MLRPSTGTTKTSKSSSSSSRKTVATCRISLNTADTRGISTLPFPTLTPAISSRPLPLPPMTHALLRSSPTTTEFHFATKRARKSSLSPLSPKPRPSPPAAAPPAPSMQRRRSRDPNVADRLVVELDDDDQQHAHCSIHPRRPSSPSPDSNPNSPGPPAYSTLPPPYSATTDEKKKKDGFTIVVEDDQPTLPAAPKPCTAPPSSSSSSSSTSSSSKRPSRVSASELRVLVYLYRTVVYGLEMRNRKEKDSDLLDPPQTTNTAHAKKKPLGPRSSRTSPSSLPEETSHFENALAKAAASKASSSSAAVPGGFAHFPLVEDDLESKDKEYTTPSTPFHSPSQSPKSSSHLHLLRPCPSLDQIPSTQFSPIPTTTTKKEKTKAEINAELHVQDALLALRLKEFLRLQGVCEDDLRVDFDEEGRAVEPLPLPEPVKVQVKVEECVVPVKEEEEADEENNILDEYFMGIEEEEESAIEKEKKKQDRGPVVEDDSPFVEQEDDLEMDPSPSPPPPPPPTLQLAPTPAQRIFSPPPASPSPRPHAVLPTSYMVALLTMRVRHPSKKPGSSSSSSGGSSGGSGSGNGNGNGNGTGSKSGTGTGTGSGGTGKKRKSGLSVLVEVD